MGRVALGRRHERGYDYVTIVRNLETGEPVWIGPGREAATVTAWLSTLTPAQKAAIDQFATDMHEPFRAAVHADEILLKDTPIVHDPFFIMKRAGKAVSEMHKDAFFRAGAEMRGLGKGTNWLVLRVWERCSPEDQEVLRCILAFTCCSASCGYPFEVGQLGLWPLSRDGEWTTATGCSPPTKEDLRRVVRTLDRITHRRKQPLPPELQ